MSPPRGRLVDGAFHLAPPEEELPPEPGELVPGRHNGRGAALLRTLRTHPGLTARELHERIALGGAPNVTGASLSALKRRGFVRVAEKRWYLGAGQPEALPQIPGPSGMRAVYGLLLGHPEGATEAQLRPPACDRYTTRNYLCGLRKQGLARDDGRKSRDRLWYPVAPGSAPEPPPAPVQPAQAPSTGETLEAVPAAALVALLDLAEAPAHPEPLMRLALLVGEVRALRGVR